jgi:hypothetical protein
VRKTPKNSKNQVKQGKPHKQKLELQVPNLPQVYPHPRESTSALTAKSFQTTKDYPSFLRAVIDIKPTVATPLSPIKPPFLDTAPVIRQKMKTTLF